MHFHYDCFTKMYVSKNALFSILAYFTVDSD